MFANLFEDAATIYEDNIHLDSFTSRILAAGNGTGKSRPASRIFLALIPDLIFRVFPCFMDCGLHN